MMPSEGKLGYEVIWTNNSGIENDILCNNFFSRKTKKSILRTSCKGTYEVEGRFGDAQFFKAGAFFRTIRWCFDNNIRFELVTTVYKEKRAVALFYTL